MPYCPKCDMEFIDGITKCTDCGGPLVESKEVADQMKDQYMKMQEEHLKKQYQQMMLAQQQAQMQAQTQQQAAAEQQAQLTPEQAEKLAVAQKLAEAKAKRAAAPSKAYVNKEQKYEDMKSTVIAFIIVGAVALAGIVLSLAGIISLPFTGVMYYIVMGILAFMAVGSFAVAISSKKSADALKGQITEEDTQTKEIIEWFMGKYSAEKIDRAIHRHMSGLSEEEMSLQRFELIQDLLITNKDLPDQSYVDALCDMIYSRLYED